MANWKVCSQRKPKGIPTHVFTKMCLIEKCCHCLEMFYLLKLWWILSRFSPIITSSIVFFSKNSFDTFLLGSCTVIGVCKGSNSEYSFFLLLTFIGVGVCLTEKWEFANFKKIHECHNVFFQLEKNSCKSICSQKMRDSSIWNVIKIQCRLLVAFR